MCGIAGGFGPKSITPDRLASCHKLMALRGPDGSGHWACETPAGNHLNFLHSRLSIVDLAERSNQPFVKNQLTLVFNGEIYNHIELRKELETLGHVFHTTGDTEVVLEAYRQWGTDFVTHMEGMWAIALYDSRQDQLILTRDRFGEKPLYLWWVDNCLYFGSEVRFLMGLSGVKADVNQEHLRRFLVNGYKSLFPSEDDYFYGIKAFPAGHVAVVKTPSMPISKPFWSVSYNPIQMTQDEALEGTYDKIRHAIELRLRADVPIALRLSGGIDSNVALGMAVQELQQDITTFSVVEDDPRYDETASILEAIKYHGCSHEIIKIPKDNFLDRLYGLIDYFGKPMMTISYYLHALVSEHIHNAGFKVSLGGTGADEIFSGYYDHYLFWLAEMQNRADFSDLVGGWRDSYGKFVRNPFLQDPEAFIKQPNRRDHIFLGAEKFSSFLKEPFEERHHEKTFCEPILRNRMLNELLHETVPVMLHEDDLSAMAYSVENRAVYLDSQLVEFVSTVPSEHLFGNSLPKYLLRRAGKGIAPESILTNPRKQGINAPVTSFVDFTDDEVQEAILDDSLVYDIIQKDKVEKLLNSTLELNSESKFLFSIISTKLFLDSHLAFQP
ncbi:asparagine synthase (glutamine-hydrolyzing) [Curvivirga aplysinae]|uniref:asparagine synthase (glutamine-hydrolyzing) n=1 Tax=Curvivirga aplysinae TaxID=2529852 RepID=UPI0012BD1471|nr:asparagine synthase (glutamine-hydrolyzing) [Curvivirga aplysinae]MTI10573.1 asparagine synthase (glutamine-hydrolyzing) [Curvivirga aplysinae]